MREGAHDHVAIGMYGACCTPSNVNPLQDEEGTSPAGACMHGGVHGSSRHSAWHVCAPQGATKQPNVVAVKTIGGAVHGECRFVRQASHHQHDPWPSF